jgi:acetolactate synthase I/III small subunit
MLLMWIVPLNFLNLGRASARLPKTYMLQVISLLVENKPGALMRITGVLVARGYNIESLTVARTLDPELSRMSIVVDIEPSLRGQVIKQMNKLINVLQASDLSEAASVKREMVLLRVRAAMPSRPAILKEAEIFGARVVDSSPEGFALEVTGESEKLDVFIDLMRSYGEIEVTRSGIVAVALDAKKLRLSAPIPKTHAADEQNEKLEART